MAPSPFTQRESLILPSNRIPPKLPHAHLVFDPKEEGYREDPSKPRDLQKKVQQIPPLPLNVSQKPPVKEEHLWMNPHCLTSAGLPPHLPMRNGSRGEAPHTFQASSYSKAWTQATQTSSSVEQRWRNDSSLLQEGKGKFHLSFRPPAGSQVHAYVPLNAHGHLGNGQLALERRMPTLSSFLPSPKWSQGLVTTWKHSHLETSCLWCSRSAGSGSLSEHRHRQPHRAQSGAPGWVPPAASAHSSPVQGSQGNSRGQMPLQLHDSPSLLRDPRSCCRDPDLLAFP
ncbi:unnamed protein product [Nyctereutes procyonoides]|uniref:(raccoon dog) hypothetical protein n=1 Tax=Nyctereutes procyonoides TaxID=34880 RepID=A0A811ZMK2_NYCPR|nr:unnamed protein product [Nyctereutes procyonoides]